MGVGALDRRDLLRRIGGGPARLQFAI